MSLQIRPLNQHMTESHNNVGAFLKGLSPISGVPKFITTILLQQYKINNKI